MMVISLTAEIWANSKPLVMSFNDDLYFPVFKTYHPSQFGEGGFVTDYRKLKMSWAVWPIVKWDPLESNWAITTYPAKPSADNWLGTDDRGRDVLSRLIYGFRYSIVFSLSVWFISYFIGCIVGAVSGYAGGWTDLIIQRKIEIWDSLPYLLVLITLAALVGASMPLLIAFSVLLGWMRISTYIRAEFLRLRKREFVEASRAQGGSLWRILFTHIFPNALGPIVTFSPAEIASNIYLLAILDYLGLGLPPPTPSWGELLQQAQAQFTVAWWLAVYPSFAMIAALTMLTFIGEGVREAYDPRK